MTDAELRDQAAAMTQEERIYTAARYVVERVYFRMYAAFVRDGSDPALVPAKMKKALAEFDVMMARMDDPGQAATIKREVDKVRDYEAEVRKAAGLSVND